jgi:hypothetical protein
MFQHWIYVLRIKVNKMNSQLIDLLKFQAVTTGVQWKTFVFISLFERLMQNIPFLQDCFTRRKLEFSPPKITSEILFERTKEDKKQPTQFQNRMDAVIHSISKIPSISKLLSIIHHDYLPHNFEPLTIEPDLYFQLLDIRINEGAIESLKFKLFSYNNNSRYLQKYVETCATDYDRYMLNKLGTHKYFFNMMTQQKKGLQNPLPTTYIMFTKHVFKTSRTFDNVFFDQKESVQKHTEFFLDRKDWYNKKGIPHTLGFMFHGEPGCGKTSTIKAIANVGNRHIINLHLSEIKSKEQLSHLFFNDDIHVWDNGKTERYNIPVGERMYVIEDIDAMGDLVLKREWKKPVSKKVEFDDRGNIIEEDEPIDLAFILNLLDGTLESEGRILAISTNFPERIDTALIRPGRIDMIIEFKKCSNKMLKQMMESFYEIEISDVDAPDRWTPAEVNQIFFRNFNDPEQALKELKTVV